MNDKPRSEVANRKSQIEDDYWRFKSFKRDEDYVGLNPTQREPFGKWFVLESCVEIPLPMQFKGPK